MTLLRGGTQPGQGNGGPPHPHTASRFCPRPAEVFHLFVTVGALLHFIAVYRVVRSPLGAGGIV